jgi:ribulose-5-phosphate 4-epimerase/fuculose-1-phosphate aldolase
MKEGIIKFQLDWKKKPLPKNLNLSELVMFRNMLAAHGLISSDKNGIGYGNISVLKKPGVFIISGSGTGLVKSARKFHFTLVKNADVKKNLIACTGLYPASSESITHYMIYKLSPAVKSVIHVHNMSLWNKLLKKVPATSERITYGTQEMAYEIRRLWNKSGLKEKKILIMGGHEGGLIVFGESIKEAYNLLMGYYNRKIDKTK